MLNSNSPPPPTPPKHQLPDRLTVAYEELFTPADRDGNRSEFQMVLLRQTLEERDELAEAYRKRFALMAHESSTSALTSEAFLVCMRNVDPDKSEFANRLLMAKGFGKLSDVDGGDIKGDIPKPEDTCDVNEFVERIRKGVLKRAEGSKSLDRRERKLAAMESSAGGAEALSTSSLTASQKKAQKAMKKARASIKLSMLPSFAGKR